MALALVVLVNVVAPGPVLGQAGLGRGSSGCEDPGAGTLGIQGLRCEGCRFTMGRSGITEATFGAEPEIIAVDPRGAGGDVLRSGDVLVAIDGALITTRGGAQRLTSIRLGDEVTVRVRRDGRLRDLLVTAGSACESTARIRPPLPPEPRRPGATELPPTLPRGVGARPTERPPLPDRAPEPSRGTGMGGVPRAPGAHPTLEPRVTLGFSFECGPCGYRSAGVGGGTWYFDEPPVVYGVDQAGPAWRGGLRQGDLLVGVDGLSLVTEEGARRFSRLEPGEDVVWTVRRDGQIREVTTMPGPPADASTPSALGSVPEQLRFSGQIGEADVEVRGAPVTVTVDRERGLMTITSADLVIYVRVPEGEGRDPSDRRP
jgi:hypothetical protein